MTDREDRQDISDVLSATPPASTGATGPCSATVFTEDCELDYGDIGTWHGVDAVTEFMEQSHAMAGAHHAPDHQPGDRRRRRPAPRRAPTSTA